MFSSLKSNIITNDDSNTISYEHCSKILTKQNVHCEAMKNLLMCMQFLCDHACKGDTVVYLGNGGSTTSTTTSDRCGKKQHYIEHIIDLFHPLDLKWQVHGMDIVLSDANCAAYVECFKANVHTNLVIEQYKTCNDVVRNENNILLMWDFQTIADDDEYLQCQVQLVQKMYPKAICLKVKPVYNAGEKTFSFFKGTLCMQPFSGQNSTEMRLFSSRHEYTAPLCTYMHKHLEESAAFFQRFVRTRDNHDEACMQTILNNYCMKIHNPSMTWHQLHLALLEFLKSNLSHYNFSSFK